jgi:hypothetical protein
MKIAENQSGSKVLVSSGAEEFDPDSILDIEQPEATKPSLEDEKILVILLIKPFEEEAFRVAGILDKIKTGPSKQTLEFICLSHVGIELMRHSIFSDPTFIEECELLGRDQESKPAIKTHFRLHKVWIEFISNNRAKVKLQMQCP